MNMVVPADEQLVDDVALLISPLIQGRPLEDRGLGVKAVAEGDILASTARQYGHEPAASRGDVAQILAAGQLAIGHVEEVAVADQLVQQVPGPDVGTIVNRVAASG